MNQAELGNVPSSTRKYWPWLVAGGVVVLGVLFLLVNRPRPRVGVQRAEQVEDLLGQARQSLARETDLGTCRSALQQFNNHLGQSPYAVDPKALPHDKLARVLGLDEDEFKEIQGSSFTLLDGRYLEQCFLFRDAAESLQTSNVQGEKRSPLERATAAFRWTVRQVRLENPGYDTIQAAPPTFILRRGWGSPLERGLVFLELLRQLGPPEQLQGCLVYCPGDSATTPRLWACGVILDGGNAVHLFDPRLGLPIPGSKPGEVATLGQLRRDPSVLGQLTLDDKHRYDVTAEQAAKADLRLVCPLSALAPRTQLLQDHLLGPTYRVRLVVAPLDDLQRLKKAAQAELEEDDRVKAWQESVRGKELDGPGLLRRFLGPEEGGNDTNLAALRRRDFFNSLRRWAPLPRPFDDPNRFPPNSDLGMRISRFFYKPFDELISDPNNPRNLILRGRFSKATPALVAEHQMIRDLVNQWKNAGDQSRELDPWLEKMFSLYARQARQAGNPEALKEINQEIEAAWAKSPALLQLYAGSMAVPRSAHLGYLLGLCKQDQAEIQQARLELLNRAGRAGDVTEVKNTWQDACSAWDRFLDEHPQDRARGAVRHLRARALEGLGQWEEAARAWENVTPPLTPLEQVAGLYQAQQIRKANEK